MHEEWDEACDLMFEENSQGKEGIFQLKDGRKFGVLYTLYGDGRYPVEDPFCNLGDIPVDAGLVGCIKVEDLPEGRGLGFGLVVEYADDFVFYSDGSGGLHFGSVFVQTGEDGYDYEDDARDYDDY